MVVGLVGFKLGRVAPCRPNADARSSSAQDRLCPVRSQERRLRSAGRGLLSRCPSRPAARGVRIGAVRLPGVQGSVATASDVVCTRPGVARHPQAAARLGARGDRDGDRRGYGHCGRLPPPSRRRDRTAGASDSATRECGVPAPGHRLARGGRRCHRLAHGRADPCADGGGRGLPADSHARPGRGGATPALLHELPSQLGACVRSRRHRQRTSAVTRAARAGRAAERARVPDRRRGAAPGARVVCLESTGENGAARCAR